MEVKATAKFLRISPRKVKLVIDIVRGKNVEEAVDVLTFTHKKAALMVKKVVQSAASNATANNNMNEDDLFISKIYVNEGPTLKRFKPRARGRATRIRKRTSHITVFVSDGKERSPEENGTKGKS